MPLHTSRAQSTVSYEGNSDSLLRTVTKMEDAQEGCLNPSLAALTWGGYLVGAVETCALVSVYVLGDGRRFPQSWVVFLLVEQEVWTQAARNTPLQGKCPWFEIKRLEVRLALSSKERFHAHFQLSRWLNLCFLLFLNPGS